MGGKREKNVGCKRIIRLFLIITIVILSLVFIELVLRISGKIYIKQYFLENANWIDKDNSNIILTLGESSTVGIWDERKDTYPSQVQNLLEEKYPNKNIEVVMPIHVGQNTGQVANRIDQHIKLYKPKIIIAMMGYNNEWSLAESRISKFIEGKNRLKIKTLITLDKLRTFRVIRYAYLKILNFKGEQDHIDALKGNQYLLGGPELVRFPPERGVYSFAKDHKEEFVELWHHDMKEIVQTAKQNNVTIMLMTYHINPSYLSAKEFEEFAKKENIMLVRNDIIFEPFIQSGEINNYVSDIDKWHPNKEGYALIAKAAYEKILESEILD